MAVSNLVSFADGIALVLIQDISRIHIIRKVPDLDPGTNKLHRNIITDPVNGDSRIIVYFSCDAVHETFVDPVLGIRVTDMALRLLKAIQGSRTNTGMKGGIVRTDIIGKHPVKLVEGRDAIDVQCIEPAFF